MIEIGDVDPPAPRRAPQPSEATEVHTRLLRLALGVDESRAYWANVDLSVPRPGRAHEAFERRWFGAKSLARCRFLVADLSDRYDVYAEALSVLSRWRGMEPAARQVICHWHLQLSDPLYRAFTGRLLPDMRAAPHLRLDRAAVVRWVRAEHPKAPSPKTETVRAPPLSPPPSPPPTQPPGGPGDGGAGGPRAPGRGAEARAPAAFSAPLDDAVQAVAKDLLAEGGPQISTMRNYRFAILPYRPKDEFKLRQLMRRLTDELRAEGWGVLPISLQKLLLDRIRATGDANVEALITREKRLFEKDPDRALGPPARQDRPAHRGGGRNRRRRRPPHRRVRGRPPRGGGSHARPHRAGRRALPVLPLVGAAQAHRRQDAKHPGGAALSRRAEGHDRALLHGRAATRPRLPAPHLPVSEGA